MAPWLAPNPPPPGHELKKGNEERSADHRPHDRKRIPADAEHERLGEMHLGRDPRTDESPNEAKGCGHDEPALRSTGESLADCATDGGDDDQHDESWQCKRHGLTTSSLSV